MSLTSKGDFVIVDYVAKVKETDTVFDTSNAEAAKQAKIFKETATYEPMLVVIGEGWVLRGLDEKLVGLEAGKKTIVEIPPEGAFGLRDANKMKLVPLRKFQREKVSPYPGLEVDVDGKPAVVRSVGAGRVQVDFNPPLAGRTLVYELEVKKTLQTPKEKIEALIHRRISNVDQSKFNIELSEKSVVIQMPEEALGLDRLQLAKRGIASDIQKFIHDIDTVTFTEKFVRKEVKASPEATSKPEQASSG